MSKKEFAEKIRERIEELNKIADAIEDASDDATFVGENQFSESETFETIDDFHFPSYLFSINGRHVNDVEVRELEKKLYYKAVDGEGRTAYMEYESGEIQHRGGVYNPFVVYSDAYHDDSDKDPWYVSEKPVESDKAFGWYAETVEVVKR